MNHQAERSFLHNIATPLSVCKLTVQIVIEDLETSPDCNLPALADVKKRLSKVLESLEKMEVMHANHKATISALEMK